MSAASDLLFFFGRIFSPLYSMVMRIRASCYNLHLFRCLKLPVPVISVGNLTMGGTGKTPMVIYLAQLFAVKKKIVIVSRGYGGKASGKINIVADEIEVLLSPAEAGDEPRLLADTLPGVPVLTGARRVITATHAVEKMGASLVIMDDGFQHMALDRDVNIVLFSASTLLGNGWVCPGGPLREAFSALARADLFVVTGIDSVNSSSVADFGRILARNFPEIPLFLGRYTVEKLSCINGLENDPGKVSPTMALYAFCGIATPQSFLNSLEGEKVQIRGHKCFRDHYPFTKDDLMSLENEALANGCTGLVTTEKDYVKLYDFNFNLPIYVLQVRLQMSSDFDEFVLGLIDEDIG